MGSPSSGSNYNVHIEYGRGSSPSWVEDISEYTTVYGEMNM